jgi:uncharacterized membrane protein
MSMSPLGTVHTVFALLAMAAGAAVCLLPKGTRWHRTLGHVYATAMAGLVVTALFIYRLTGGFGLFHIFALVAAATLAAGLGTVLLRRPRGSWMEAHATWMSWSYVGLLAAFVSESLTRVVMPRVAPLLREHELWGLFWTLVGVATLVVVLTGRWLIGRYLPRALERAPTAMREERRRLREVRDGGWGSPEVG